MMREVPRDDEHQAAGGQRPVVHRPAPRQHRWFKRSHKRQRGRANRGQLSSQVAQLAPGCVGRLGERLLVEARERRRVATRGTEQVIRRDALGIGKVPDDLFYAPLPRRIPMR
jgi:hypothetical protein